MILNNDNNIQHKDLDFSYIYDIAGGRQEFFVKLLNAIFKSLNEYPPKINQAYQDNDLTSMREMAHKFKSSISYLGYEAFNNALNTLELADDTLQNTSTLDELMKNILQYTEESLLSVEAKLKEFD